MTSGWRTSCRKDEDVGNNAEELTEEVEVTKVANPFAMKLRGFTPGGPVWRHVRSSAQHHQVQFPSTRQPVFCWLLLLKCQFAAGQLKANGRAKKVTIDAKRSVRDG